MRTTLVASTLMILTIAGCHRSRTASRQPVYQDPPVRQSQPRMQPPPTKPAPMPAPRYTGPTWYPAGRKISERWTTVVIHHSATDKGSAKVFDGHHRSKGWDELGYHFVIGNGSGAPDGMIEVGPRWHKQKHGAHCKTQNNYYNEHGIGICLVGDFTRTRPTQRQLNSLYQLVRFLTSHLNIPPEGVTTHCLVKGGTLCPGKYFALAPLRNALAGAGRRSAYDEAHADHDHRVVFAGE